MSIRGDQVKAAILQTGLLMWPNVTARGVGERLGLTHAGVIYHTGSSDGLRKAVAEYAVRIKDARVVPQLIVARHPAADQLSAADRAAFLAQL